MNKLWSISDVATMVNVSNKTILNKARKHNVISSIDKQGRTYWLTDEQLQRLLYICYPKAYGLMYGSNERTVMRQQPVPTSIGKITYVTYKDKRYWRIVNFPLRYTDDGAIEYYKTQSFATKEDAMAHRQELINERSKGLYQEKHQQSFYDVILEVLSKRPYKVNTRMSIDNALKNYFKPYFETISLEDINREVLQKFLDKTTVSTMVCRSILSVVLKELWLDDKIDKDYRSQLRKPKIKTQKEKRALTIDELQEYYGLIKNKPLAFICHLMFATGLRIGEALALTWEDFEYMDNGLVCVNVNKNISYDNGKIHEDTPKTLSSIRKVYFNDTELREALLEKQQNATSKYIAYNHRLKRRENGLLFNKKYFYNIGKKMGIPLSSHYARVTYASYALAKGVSLKNVQQQMGHSDSMMLHKIYAKPIGDVISQISEHNLYH